MVFMGIDVDASVDVDFATDFKSPNTKSKYESIYEYGAVCCWVNSDWSYLSLEARTI